jgi:ABC-type nitrate/sulfonate/bicarbonate transport system permease component
MRKALPILPLLLVALAWQAVCMAGVIPQYMLPSPLSVARAFVGDFPLLMMHLRYTLIEALAGLALSIVTAAVLAVIMDMHALVKHAVNPFLLMTQTMPVIALAPLLVLWLGYGMAPKIMLIFLTCFFPLTVALAGGFAEADVDAIRLLKSMGARQKDIYFYIKFQEALPAFFSGLKISSSYAVIGAVVAEWLGGNAGLGVYMTRVRKSYSFDKMFAVIFLTSALSLVLIQIVAGIERRAMPWKRALPSGH